MSDELLAGLQLEKLQSGCPDDFLILKDTPKDSSFVGVYIGSYWQSYAGDKVFEKPSQVHRILQANGRILGISEAGGLSKDLNDGTKGKIVKITYLGRVVMTSGKFAGNEAHSFEVVSPPGDNAATLALKKKAATIPPYTQPPMPALPSLGSLPALPPPPGSEPSNIFAGEQMPLI